MALNTLGIIKNGTKIKIPAVFVPEPVYPNAGAHNSRYRGKFLGNSVSAEQYAQIKAGTFEDLFIGDYWTIPTTISGNTTNINYRIAGFDYYLHCGDTETTAHHAVLVPDTVLYTAKMNDSNTTAGGYLGSKMYTSYIANAKTAIKNAFGNAHILSHRVYLSNAVSGGYVSGGAWADGEVDLMCEQMLFGSGIFSPVSNGSSVPANARMEKSQLPLFAQDHSKITIRENYWLRDVITGSTFSFVDMFGNPTNINAGYAYGVRPSFCIYEA